MRSKSKNFAGRRGQRGQVIEEYDRWCGRWREEEVLPSGTPLRKGDTILPSGEVLHRKRKWDVLAPRQGVTRQMAEQMLADRINGINGDFTAVTPVLQWLENLGVKLCDDCRGRLVAAIRSKPGAGRPAGSR